MTARDIAAATAMVGCGLAAAAIGAIRTAERRIAAHAGPVDERDDCPHSTCTATECNPDYCRVAHRRAGMMANAHSPSIDGSDRALGGGQ